MDKALLKKTLEKVGAISRSQVAALRPDEIEVLKDFYAAQQDRSASLSERESSLHKRVAMILKLRQHLESDGGESAPSPSSAASLLPALRPVLEKFRRRSYAELTEGELRQAEETITLLKSQGQLDASSQRLLEMLTGFLAAYQAAFDDTEDSGQVAPVAAIVRPMAKNKVKAEALFTKKPRKEVRLLDSIETDLRVSVYQLEGETELEGDIPEEALLVVREGGVTIHGLVEGNVVATEDILVHGNVTNGWLISSKGNIRARNALNRARIVARQGTVELDQCVGPACVFAQGKLHIHGDMHGGKILGRAIEIEGRVRSGHVHAVGLIQANRFEMTDGRSTVICLRDYLSSEEYGRPLEKEERRLYRSIGKYAYDASVLRRLIEYTKRDTLDSMRTMLYYLLAGLANAQDVRTLRGIQGQTNLLAELTRTVKQLSSTLHIIIDAGHPLADEEAAILATKCLDSLKLVSEDTEAMAASFDFSLKGVITKACRDITGIATRIKKNELSFEDFSELVENLNELSEKWLEMSRDLAQQMQAQLEDFGLSSAMVAQIESEPAKLENLLEKTIAHLEKQRSGEGYQRLKSSVMRLMQTRLQRSRDNIANWKRSLCSTELELSGIRRALSRNAAFVLAPNKTGATRVQANYFERDVVLSANPISQSDPVSTAVSVQVVENTLHETCSFLLDKGMLQRLSSGALGLDAD